MLRKPEAVAEEQDGVHSAAMQGELTYAQFADAIAPNLAILYHLH